MIKFPVKRKNTTTSAQSLPCPKDSPIKPADEMYQREGIKSESPGHFYERAHNPTRGQFRIQPGVDPFRQFSSYAHRERNRTWPALASQARPVSSSVRGVSADHERSSLYAANEGNSATHCYYGRR